MRFRIALNLETVTVSRSCGAHRSDKKSPRHGLPPIAAGRCSFENSYALRLNRSEAQAFLKQVCQPMPLIDHDGWDHGLFSVISGQNSNC